MVALVSVVECWDETFEVLGEVEMLVRMMRLWHRLASNHGFPA